MALLRVGWRSRIDRLWQARAEKQRRLGLGLGDPPAPPRLTPNDSISFTASEAGFVGLCEADSSNEAAETPAVEEAGDGADRVGTLLVRMGQLDGVGGVGLLSVAPKAIATLVLEESSATLEEMNLETNSTEVCLIRVVHLVTIATDRCYGRFAHDRSGYPWLPRSPALLFALTL